MPELTPWTGGKDKQLSRLTDGITRDARLKAHKIDAEAAVTAHAMERVSDIDSYRQTLAQGDMALNSALIQLELGYIARVSRIINGWEL